jgi:hypothetical protein
VREGTCEEHELEKCDSRTSALRRVLKRDQKDVSHGEYEEEEQNSSLSNGVALADTKEAEIRGNKGKDKQNSAILETYTALLYSPAG